MTRGSESGARLPPRLAERYHIVSAIGAGGMGEVHLATDTRLNRPVAIKAIAPSRLRDPGAVARLRAEALTAASLDHPYICKIYELLEEGDELFIVMEFIEGKTLAEMLRDGPLPVPDTVRIAAEIAEGLENAHARGLVHRDIKPSNVIVTAHGHVKLLDFGIAGTDVTSAPGSDTRTASQERLGHGPGTPEYMAPEQATGSPVTARADLFALGVVIYQCLTGRLPFDGMTSFDYVRHMLSDAPRPLHRLAGHAPDELVHLVERCLEKTPAHRPESAAEMRAVLRRVAASLDPATGTARAPASRRVLRRRLTVATTLVVLAGAAAGVWLWLSQSAPEPAPVLRQLRRFSTSPGEEWGSRFSPDGQWVSFLAERGGVRQLFLQRIDGGQPQPVTLPPGLIDGHLWSPDGKTLACLMWTAVGDHLVVHIVDAFFGGAPRRTIPVFDLDVVRSSSPGAGIPNVTLLRWIDQSSIYLQIATRRRADLHRLDLATATHAIVKGPWSLLDIQGTFDVHPDGQQVAFIATADGQDDLWVSAMAGGEPRRLTRDAFFDRYPLWGAGGSTIVFQSNRAGQVDLWEILPATGAITQITSSADVEQPEDTYRDGSALFKMVGEKTTLETIDLASSRQVQLAQESLSDFAPTVSADGQIVAFQRSTPAPLEGSLPMDSQLFFARLGAPESPLGAQQIGESGFAPRLSPDGKWVACLQRAAAGEPGPNRLRLTELDTNRTLAVTNAAAMPALSVFPVSWADQLVAWSASSDAVYFVEAAAGHQVRRFSIGSNRAEPLLRAPTDDRTTDLHMSPDGRTLGALARTDDRYRLRQIDLLSREASIVHEFGRNQRARYLGWTREGAGAAHVLARTVTVNDDSTRDVEVELIGASGGPRVAGRIPSAAMDTIRLVPGGAVLYLTRFEKGIANIYSYSLTTRDLRRITNNTLVDVTFAAVEPVRLDRLVTVRDERKQDIWLLDAGRPSAPAAAPGR